MEPILRALKKLRPFALRVELADGTQENLAVPQKHRKWQAVEAMLEKLRWVQISALDGKGQVVGIFDNDAVAGELEDLELEDSPATGQLARLAQLFLHGQDVALRRQESLIDRVLTINLKLSDVLMSRLDSLERSYQQNLKELQKLMMSEGDSEEMMSTPLVQGLLMKAAMSMGQKPTPPTNNNPVE